MLIAPLMPGINDDPRQVEEILELCGEAGAVNIGGIPLHLRGEVRGIFFEWLRSYRPDLVARYEELYARGAYVGSAEQERDPSGSVRWRDRSAEPGLQRARSGHELKDPATCADADGSRSRRACSDESSR